MLIAARAELAMSAIKNRMHPGWPPRTYVFMVARLPLFQFVRGFTWLVSLPNVGSLPKFVSKLAVGVVPGLAIRAL